MYFIIQCIFTPFKYEQFVNKFFKIYFLLFYEKGEPFLWEMTFC